MDSLNALTSSYLASHLPRDCIDKLVEENLKNRPSLIYCNYGIAATDPDTLRELQHKQSREGVMQDEGDPAKQQHYLAQVNPQDAWYGSEQYLYEECMIGTFDPLAQQQYAYVAVCNYTWHVSNSIHTLKQILRGYKWSRLWTLAMDMPKGSGALDWAHVTKYRLDSNEGELARWGWREFYETDSSQL